MVIKAKSGHVEFCLDVCLYVLEIILVLLYYDLKLNKIHVKFNAIFGYYLRVWPAYKVAHINQQRNRPKAVE